MAEPRSALVNKFKGAILALFALLSGASLAIAAPQTLGGPGGNLTNAVGVWGQDVTTGLPCVIAPNGGSSTCRLPGSQVVGGRVAMTINTAIAPGTRFVVNATVAGNVTVTFNDGSSGTYPVQIGLNVFPFAVTQFTAITATGTCENWY